MAEDKKSKLYIFIFVAMIITALVLVISRQFEKPDEAKTLEEKLSEVIANKEGEILGNKDDLVYFNIKPYDKVQDSILYNGAVKGGYFFEANILINILDANKNAVLESYASAKSDWMTSEPVLFGGEIDLTKIGTTGLHYIEIHNDNASGLPENDKNILIPIIIN
jgi:hypothetical protein